VVAHGQRQGARGSEAALRRRIASRFAGGRWTFDGTTLTLTWPRPGGTPKVNTVRLSDDGTTYQGKNDRDWVVKGVKIPDQP
jgi:hypothetical protein